MIIMFVPVLLAAVAGVLHGGRVWNLAHLSVKHSWIPLLMFALQFEIVLFPQGQSELLFGLRPWVTTATYALLIAFLFVNRRLPGIKLILIGALLNLAVILANGSHMPVTRDSLARSGHLDRIVVHDDQAFVQGSKDIVLSGEEIRLRPLSDFVGIPESFPTSATFSVGDIFIMVGAAWLTYAALIGIRSRHRLPVPGAYPSISPLQIIQAEPLDTREVDL
jgi:hypothetical protein